MEVNGEPVVLNSQAHFTGLTTPKGGFDWQPLEASPLITQAGSCPQLSLYKK